MFFLFHYMHYYLFLSFCFRLSIAAHFVELTFIYNVTMFACLKHLGTVWSRCHHAYADNLFSFHLMHVSSGVTRGVRGVRTAPSDTITGG